MRAIGKSGARSAGPSGCMVPGWSGGGGGEGRSAAMLYQVRGMRSSSSTNLVRLFGMRASPGVCREGGSVRDRPVAVRGTRLQRAARVSQGSALEKGRANRNVAGRAAPEDALEEDDPVHGPRRVERRCGRRKG